MERNYLLYWSERKLRNSIVSSDIIDNEHSCIFDSLSTYVVGDNLIKVIGWYDNEWGYSSSMVDLIELIAKI